MMGSFIDNLLDSIIRWWKKQKEGQAGQLQPA